MAGAGKRTALHAALAAVAAMRGIPFSVTTKALELGSTATGNVAEAGATEEGAGPDDGDGDKFMHEASLVHMGFDIARMSMQDKN